MWNFPLLPDVASSVAGEVDALFYFLVSVSIFFSLIIIVGLSLSAIRYRKGSKASRKGAKDDFLPVEILWSVVPFVVAIGIFTWAAKLFIEMRVPPKDAM
jgi:cytochrome c oxidase subunit 2